MKRSALVLVPALALVLAAAAFGAIRVKHFQGTVDDDLCGGSQVTCDVEFDATSVNKRVTEVDNFKIAGIPMQCDQATIVVQTLEGLELDWVHVNRKRKFHASASGSPNAEITVKGRFSKNFKTARGTLVNTLSDPPQVTNCTTGVDHWVARP